MNPHPPADEAVKSALMFADGNYLNMQQAQPMMPYAITPDKSYAEIAARILAAHARAKDVDLDKLVEEIDVMNDELSIARGETFKAESEVERLRAALEEIGYVAGRMDGRGETCSSFANSIKGILSEALSGKDGVSAS